MEPPQQSAPEYAYVLLLFALFVLPKLLQRFAIPSPITSLALGAGAGIGFGWFMGDATVHILSTFGIASLFLFAGLDVDLKEIRGRSRVIGRHLVVHMLGIVLVVAVAFLILELELRAATLFALALMTPSAGFILDSLDRLAVDTETKSWVRSKAVATELVCLAILFAAIRSTSTSNLLLATGALVAIVLILPYLFRLFAAFVIPHAPKSEFAFLMMMAVACGTLTYQLGVYYLVGAFVVGIAAQRLRSRMPAMASERMLHSVEAFASLFVPFYFFSAGTKLRAEDLSLGAFAIGALLVVVLIPLRIGTLWIVRRTTMGESFRGSLRVGAPLIPTLVFTLVIAEILRDRFGLAPQLFGALVMYAVLTSLFPGIAFGIRLPEPADELELDAVSRGEPAPQDAGVSS